MTEIESARVLLGIKEGDGETKIRERYRLLVYAWHPDRFADNAQFRPAAESEMARINEAYALVTGKRKTIPRAKAGKNKPKMNCGEHTYEDTLLRCDKCGQLVCHLCASATRAGGYLCTSCNR